MFLLLVTVLLGYLLGSIPFGVVIVKLTTGADVRQHGSGRTGGTNAWRTAGRLAGLSTTVLDALKAACSVWLAQWLVPHDMLASVDLNYLAMALAGLTAVLGHNYSLFLGFKGGAGGAPAVGAMFALWGWSLFIVVPFGIFVWFVIGYASLATLTVGLGALVLFAFRAYFFSAPAEFIVYGAGVIVLLAWALRPNIQRLLRGEEKRFNPRARAAVAEAKPKE